MQVTDDKISLSHTEEQFIVHWGEMGNRWGLNRTMAQVHALLYLSPNALHAEQLQNTLQVARSNISTCLRELQGWGIVRIVHVLGDRRDHFESLRDVWEMFRIIIAERKRRELDPTITLLQQCVDGGDESDALSRQRMGDILEFFEAMTAWYESINALPDPALKAFVKLGPKIPSWVKRNSSN